MYTQEYYETLDKIECVYWKKKMIPQWYAVMEEIFICEIALGLA